MSKRTSHIWNFFSITDKEMENKNLARCNICKQVLSYKSSVSNLKRHLVKKHPTVKILPSGEHLAEEVSGGSQESQDGTGPVFQQNNSESDDRMDTSVPSTSSSSTFKRTDNKSDRKTQQTIANYIPKKITVSGKKHIDTQLLKLFYLDYQPFSVVEDKGFCQFIKALNPSYQLPSRGTISKSYIPSLYEECLIATKAMVKKEVLQVCLTTDCWTSRNNDSFNAITIHFIDENFELRSILLKCAVFDKSHTIENLSEELKNVTEEWGLENKVLLAVSDNAANIKGAIVNGMGWKFFGCYAHNLNLIVQDALIIVKSTVDKVKTVVSHFKRSTKATVKLNSFQENAGVKTPKKLIQDIVTRWNSTFFMIERFIELEEAVRSTVAILDTDLPQLTSEEWQILKDLKKILEPFEDATKAVSGQRYMTASMVILITGSLLDICRQVLKDTSVSLIVKNVVKKLESGITERVGKAEYSNTLAMCTFLDPRMKSYPFRNADAVERVRKNVTAALAELISQNDVKQISQSVPEEKCDVPKTMDTVKPSTSTFSIWAPMDKVVAKESSKTTLKSSTARAIIEVQRYKEDGILDKKEDPLQWWNNQKFLYPNLSYLVKHKCCVVATSVPCESLFSKAGNMLTERRNRLSSKKIEQLLFLNHNTQ